MNSLRQGGAFWQYPDEEKERKIHEAALARARQKAAIRRWGSSREDAAAFATAYRENVLQKAFISYNGAMRCRPLAELADSGELWLEDDSGKRLSITERNFHLLYERGRYNTLCLRLEGRTLRFKRDVRIAGLFWEVA